jgi:hypothetical protein
LSAFSIPPSIRGFLVKKAALRDEKFVAGCQKKRRTLCVRRL